MATKEQKAERVRELVAAYVPSASVLICAPDQIAPLERFFTRPVMAARDSRNTNTRWW